VIVALCDPRDGRTGNERTLAARSVREVHAMQSRDRCRTAHPVIGCDESNPIEGAPAPEIDAPRRCR
jgi:hypothetical protein